LVDVFLLIVRRLGARFFPFREVIGEMSFEIRHVLAREGALVAAQRLVEVMLRHARVKQFDLTGLLQFSDDI
jgi:hypothetical protein